MKFLEGLNWVCVLGIVVAVETQIGNGSMSLANMIPVAWIPAAKAWAANLGSIGALIMSVGVYGKPASGVQPSITPAVVKVLLLAFALSFLVAVPSAQAQTRAVKKPAESGPVFTGDLGTDIKNGFKGDPNAPGAIQLTGNAEKDMQVIVKRIQAIGRDDMNYAILKATAANTNGSKVRLQCLQAILAAKNAAEGTDIKDANGNVIPRPDPAVVTAIEDVAELVDALSPQGPLMTGCAGAAQLFKTNTLAAINGIVTGAAGIAALPAGL